MKFGAEHRRIEGESNRLAVEGLGLAKVTDDPRANQALERRLGLRKGQLATLPLRRLKALLKAAEGLDKFTAAYLAKADRPYGAK